MYRWSPFRAGTANNTRAQVGRFFGAYEASGKADRASRKEIRKLQRNLARKERALAETAALLVLSKNRGDLPRERARMTSLEDRKAILDSMAEARDKGARLTAIGDIIGVDVRTLRRWSTATALAEGDRRPAAERPAPVAQLTDAEREAILEIANREKYASLPPTRIVPMLADEGIYVASESSSYRVLKGAGQLMHRGPSKAPVKQSPPTTHVARAPNELWAWDMTYLPTQVIGQWFLLYLILDVFSRKIEAWEVHATDDAEHAARVVKRAALAEGIAGQVSKPVLHGDKGATLKATTVRAMLNWLGIKSSYSRTRVSDDNAFPEALFKTAKYRPGYPERDAAYTASTAPNPVARFA